MNRLSRAKALETWSGMQWGRWLVEDFKGEVAGLSSCEVMRKYER